MDRKIFLKFILKHVFYHLSHYNHHYVKVCKKEWRNTMSTNKLVIVGAGNVGSYVLADAMKIGLFSEIVVIDQDQGIAFGEALDQAHAIDLPYMQNTHVNDDDYYDCTDADIIVCAEGPSIVNSKDDAMPDRALLAVNNSKVTREVMEGITTYTKYAIIIFITNPLDTVVY